MTDPGLVEQRERFLAYLRATLGEDAAEALAERQGLRVGERVLYRLAGGGIGTRREPTKEEIEHLRSQMVQLAKSTGVEESAVTFEPPRSSGGPHPRLIDLPGSTIIWDTELDKFLKSDDPLPSRDFPLEWAVGVLRTSEDLFLYLDFTRPKVKAVFRVAYDPGDLRLEGARARLRGEFRQFREKERDLNRRVEADPRIMWAKIVQLDMEPASIRIRTIE